jgi:hypothetical protein
LQWTQHPSEMSGFFVFPHNIVMLLVIRFRVFITVIEVFQSAALTLIRRRYTVRDGSDKVYIFLGPWSAVLPCLSPQVTE